MRTKNILDGSFNLKYIYWLCKDSKFFKECLDIMRAKQWFDPTLWSFSIMHKDLTAMIEYFNSKQSNLKKIVGADFKSKLITVNDRDEEDDMFNFLDYYPLMNPRAHRVGGMDL